MSQVLHHLAVVRAPVPKRPIWLVTFGDLLTLLLGFFIAGLALSGPKGEAKKGLSPLDTSIKMKFGGVPSEISPAGTRLANNNHDRTTFSELMEGREIEIGGGSPSSVDLSAKLTKLQTEMDLRGYVVEEVSVFAGTPSGKGEVEAETIRKVAGVRGQLIDRGIPAPLVRVTLSSAACTEGSKCKPGELILRFKVRKADG
jgi:hypothetical protein